jgi:hypothetical protein
VSGDVAWCSVVWCGVCPVLLGCRLQQVLCCVLVVMVVVVVDVMSCSPVEGGGRLSGSSFLVIENVWGIRWISDGTLKLTTM